MKIRAAVPENGCLIFLTDGKNKKQNKTKNKITSAKHIRVRLLPEGGCVKQKKRQIDSIRPLSRRLSRPWKLRLSRQPAVLISRRENRG